MTQIQKILAIMADLSGKDFTKESVLLLAADLETYPEAAVMKALGRCRMELKYFPTLSEIISRIDDGRPGAEEAWAMIPKDEEGSVVWTEEMAEAFGTCRAVFDHDPVAARMTFREVYTRKITQARAERRPPRWTPSLGSDRSGREAALKQAVQLQRISQGHAAELLPDMTRASQARMIADQSTPKGELYSITEFLRDLRERIKNSGNEEGQ